MNEEIRNILSRIIELEDELEELLTKQQHELKYHFIGTMEPLGKTRAYSFFPSLL